MYEPIVMMETSTSIGDISVNNGGIIDGLASNSTVIKETSMSVGCVDIVVLMKTSTPV
jgi:hypothetical protein